MGSITALSQPELTVFNSGSTFTLSISAFGTDKGLYTKTYTPASGFTNWVRGGDITIKGRPSVSFFNEKLVQSAYGTDNGLYNRTSTNGLNWTPWVRASTITLSGRVEQTIFKLKLYQFAPGSNNGLYTRSSVDGLNWTLWARDSNGITILNEPSTTFYNFSGTLKLLQMVHGTDKGYYFRSSIDGADWQDWYRLDSNVTFSDKPQFTNLEAGCLGNFSLFAYGQGTDHKLYKSGVAIAFDYQGSDSPIWSLFLGAITIKNTPTEAHARGYDKYTRIESARGTDNRVYTRVWRQ